MILSCPSCKTRFSAADNAFAAGPRRVRCATCQHVWLAGEPQDDPPMAGSEPGTSPPYASESGGHHSFANVLAGVNPDAAMAVARSMTPPPWKEWVLRLNKLKEYTRWLKWLSISRSQAKIISAILLFALILLFVIKENAMVAHIPSLRPIYAMLGFHDQVIAENLDLKLTKVEKCLVSGRDMLCLEGKVVNKGTGVVEVPVVRVTALDVDGHALTDPRDKSTLSWTIKSQTGKLLGGESRSFILTVPYPEQAITDFDYNFTDDDK